LWLSLETILFRVLGIRRLLSGLLLIACEWHIVAICLCQAASRQSCHTHIQSVAFVCLSFTSLVSVFLSHSSGVFVFISLRVLRGSVSVNCRKAPHFECPDVKEICNVFLWFIGLAYLINNDGIHFSILINTSMSNFCLDFFFKSLRLLNEILSIQISDNFLSISRCVENAFKPRIILYARFSALIAYNRASIRIYKPRNLWFYGCYYLSRSCAPSLLHCMLLFSKVDGQAHNSFGCVY